MKPFEIVIAGCKPALGTRTPLANLPLAYGALQVARGWPGGSAFDASPLQPLGLGPDGFNR